MIRVALLFSLVLVSGCSSPRPTPRPDLNGLLRQSVNSRRDPSLGGRWLASLGQRNGRERVELIDLRSRSPVPLPGLNRADAQPISVSVSAEDNAWPWSSNGRTARNWCSTGATSGRGNGCRWTHRVYPAASVWMARAGGWRCR